MNTVLEKPKPKFVDNLAASMFARWKESEIEVRAIARDFIVTNQMPVYVLNYNTLMFEALLYKGFYKKRHFNEIWEDNDRWYIFEVENKWRDDEKITFINRYRNTDPI